MPDPLVTEPAPFLQLLTPFQLLDPIHQIVRILMVHLCEERIAVGSLQLVILLLHGADLRVIAQLAIDMHLRHVIVLQTDAVELVLIDRLQEGERLTVIAHGRALEGPEHTTVTSTIPLVLADSPLLSLIDIVEGRIIHESLVAFIQLECQLIFLFGRSCLDILQTYLLNLPLIVGHIFRGVVDSIIYLLIDSLQIIVLSRKRQTCQQNH